MKRLIVIAVMAVLALGLVGSGCSKKVAREANVSIGDYYTEEEFDRLSKKQRDAYCEDLAGELERLSRETTDAERTGGQDDLADLRREKTRLQTRFQGQKDQVDTIEREIEYYESLPTSYTVVRGDCLWKISGKEAIYADPLKWPRLYRANRDQIKDPDLIYPKQVLDIPRDWPGMHTVVRGEYLSKIAGYWEIYDDYKQWPKIYEANRDKIDDPDLIFPDQALDIPR